MPAATAILGRDVSIDPATGDVSGRDVTIQRVQDNQAVLPRPGPSPDGSTPVRRGRAGGRAARPRGRVADGRAGGIMPQTARVRYAIPRTERRMAGPTIGRMTPDARPSKALRVRHPPETSPATCARGSPGRAGGADEPGGDTVTVLDEILGRRPRGCGGPGERGAAERVPRRRRGGRAAEGRVRRAAGTRGRCHRRGEARVAVEGSSSPRSPIRPSSPASTRPAAPGA